MDEIDSSLPQQYRRDLGGKRICRWCSTRLETRTYISLKDKRRAEQLSCPKCDAGSVLWRNEFGDDDGA